MKRVKYISERKMTRFAQARRRKEIQKDPELHDALRKKRVEEYLKTLDNKNSSVK
jgi:uncharacterized membrane protein YukC